MGLHALSLGKGFVLRKLYLAAVLVLLASGAQAATLTISGGQLTGATGVDVGGTLYDVQFIDGSCVDLYSGCDETSDFPFHSTALALLASQALLDQVFLDGVLGLFNSDPALTQGLGPVAVKGGIMSPHTTDLWGPEFHPAQLPIPAVVAYNRVAGFGPNSANAAAYHTPTEDLTTNTSYTYAVWGAASIVPEPTTALMLTLGLAGLGMRRRLH